MVRTLRKLFMSRIINTLAFKYVFPESLWNYETIHFSDSHYTSAALL